MNPPSPLAASHRRNPAWGKRAVVLGLSLLLVVGVTSCASLGTSTRIADAEALPSVKSVAIWPIFVFPYMDKLDEKFPEIIDVALANPATRGELEWHGKNAESTLAYELRESGLFSVVSADTVLARLALHDSTHTRFKQIPWFEHNELIPGDAIVLTKVSFGREGGGVNSYVTLSLCERMSGDTVVVAKFNTKWGKSYLFEKSADVTLPDAMRGAVRGLIGAIREQSSKTSDR